MFTGLTTKISESIVPLTATMKPQSDLVIVKDTTNTTVITTIIPPYGGFSGTLYVYNSSGASITTTTAGNLTTATTIGSGLLVTLVFSQSLGKFIVGTTT